VHLTELSDSWRSPLVELVLVITNSTH
jgi:hypothetical protein